MQELSNPSSHARNSQPVPHDECSADSRPTSPSPPAGRQALQQCSTPMVSPLYGHAMNTAWFPVGSYASFADVAHLYTVLFGNFGASRGSPCRQDFGLGHGAMLRGYRRDPAISNSLPNVSKASNPCRCPAVRLEQ